MLSCQGELAATDFRKSRISALGLDFFADGGVQCILRCFAGVRLPVILCDDSLGHLSTIHRLCGLA